MPVEFQKTTLPGVLLIGPQVYKDSRGFFMETFHKGKYKEVGIDQNFVQDNYSHSSSGTLRGLHYQLKHPQGKLIYVISGEIFDVAVDIRHGSPTFGQWEGFSLSSENRRQVYIPGGFAHGFCVLSESADVLYKCTDAYMPDDEYGIVWSDETVGIRWPVKEPTVSDKDRQSPGLREIPISHLPVFAS
ncbi:MAG: dTDP-4-dehydrorhamnose 3,5-epimerase [Planctomycetes bacterium]|nr:dTDP-4-dehydrorhamnose 3,5-epimerase [Planctomycetota bacterium]